MKRLISLVLALMMVLVVAAASAATIQVKDVIDGEEYNAYKILNYEDNGKTGDDRVVSYYLTATEYGKLGTILESAGFHFTASADGTRYFVDNGATFDAAAAAEYLGEHTDGLANALDTGTATGASGSATFTGLDAGYYFVTSTAGSLCALHEDTDIATVVEKNTIPGEDKKQSADGTNYTDAQLDLNIGDTVYYQVEIKDGKGTNAAIILTDTLSAGLTLKQDSITVEKGDANVAAANYTITDLTAQGFKLTLIADYVATLNENEIVTVKYAATINENAVINDVNPNTAKLDYSNQHQEDHTDVKTYDFKVYKTDGTNFLDGAEFKLYDAATGGNQILIANEGNGEYVKDATASPDVTIDINSANGCRVRGLAPGTYYLEEVVVPNGYNKLASRTEVTVRKDQTAAAEITVVNNAGTELPSTGGIGTTIFYVVGGLLLIGAAVVLVARRKASN